MAAVWLAMWVSAAVGAIWLTGCSDETGPRWVQTIDIGPDSLHLAPGGTGFIRVVRALDQYGDELPKDWLPFVTWNNLTPSVITMEEQEGGVSVTALNTGRGEIRAELGRDHPQAPIYIHPSGLRRIEIDPPMMTVSLLSGTGTAYARLYDSSGVEINPNGYRLSWKTADTTIAVTANPHFFEFAKVKGVKAGRTRLRLVVGDETVSSDVRVVAAPLAPWAPAVNTLSSESLELIWLPVTGAGDGYRLYRSLSEGGPYAHIASPGEGQTFATWDTTFVDTGLNPGTTYFYQVEACHWGPGGCSERSPPGSGTTASGK